MKNIYLNDKLLFEIISFNMHLKVGAKSGY